MTVCGKHGKTIKPFSHPSHSPWKSLRRFPHYHRHDYDEHEFLSKPVKNKTRRNDAQYHYPGGPNQMVKVGHAGIANSPIGQFGQFQENTPEFSPIPAGIAFLLVLPLPSHLQ